MPNEHNVCTPLALRLGATFITFSQEEISQADNSQVNNSPQID